MVPTTVTVATPGAETGISKAQVLPEHISNLRMKFNGSAFA